MLLLLLAIAAIPVYLTRQKTTYNPIEALDHQVKLLDEEALRTSQSLLRHYENIVELRNRIETLEKRCN